MATRITLSRRSFIKTATAAGGGLVIGCYFSPIGAVLDAAGTFEPNVWIKIGADDSVRIMLTMIEMGQGVMTSMPMLVAEELDFDWTKIKTEWAPADTKYGNPNFGGAQLTAGSNSVRGMWKLMREAGASARTMLVGAAAQTWGVPESACTTDKGVVIHQASGRRLSYGALVDKAAGLPVPKTVTLKNPGAFKVLGTSVARLDIPEKVNGSAVFGLDVKLPGPASTPTRRRRWPASRTSCRLATASRWWRPAITPRRRASRCSRSPGTKAPWRPCRAPAS
jgi:isoquinoline 1-oxidoreductase beta subunit